MKSGLLPTKTKTAFLCAALAALSALLILPHEAKAQTLSVTNVLHNRVTLSISGHSASWWYNYTPGGGTCQSGGALPSYTVKPLSPQTTYSFTAYSDSGCSNRIGTSQSATTLKVPTITPAPSNDSATLTINDWTGNWSYKSDLPNAQCHSAGASNTATVTGLTANTQYTYNAYEKTNCQDSLASTSFTTRNPVLTATEITGSGAKLTLKDGTGAWNDAWWYDWTSGSDSSACVKVPAGTASASLGLQYSRSYAVWTYDTAGCMDADKQASVNIKTPHQSTRPPALENFTVSPGPNYDEVTLRWDSAESHWNVYKYHVWLSKRGESNPVITERFVDNDKNSYVFPHPDDSVELERGTEYTGYVRYSTYPLNANNWISETATAHGSPKAPKAGQVENVTLVPGPTEGSLTASWKAIDDAYAYDVALEASNPSYLNARNVQGKNNTSTTFSGLNTNPDSPAYQIGVTHTVNVKAKRRGGSDGPWSEDATGAPKWFAPAKVTGVSVAKGANAGSLSVSWSSVTNATGYKVQWKSRSESFSDTRQNTETGTSSTITGLTGGVEHTVRVSAVRTNARADGLWSDEAKQAPPYAPTPGQVTGVSVAKGANAGSLSVSWSSVTNATGYKVQWKSRSESFSDTRQNTETGTSSTITGLTGGVEHTVQVSAVRTNAQADGPWSDEAKQTPYAPTPGQVTGVSVNPGVRALSVSWSGVTNATGFDIWWKKSSVSSWSKKSISTGDATTYTITGLTNGTAYTVQVRATNRHAQNTEGQWSGQENATTLPGQVTGVSVNPGVRALSVSWSGVTNATGYKVQWKSGRENWSSSRQNTESKPNPYEPPPTSSSIMGLTGGVTYAVRVIAYNADGGGVPSQSATGTAKHPKPNKVGGVSVTEQVEQLQVTWSALQYATGYKVQWKSGSENWSSSRTNTVSGGSSSRTIISSLTAGTRYSVQVIATRTHADDGAPSDTKTGIPEALKPNQVGNVRVTGGGSLIGGSWVPTLAVTWNAVTGTLGYHVQWKSGNQGFDSVRQKDISNGNTTTTDIDTGLTGGTEYTVQVRAIKDNADAGGWSAPATARTKKQPPSQVTGLTLTPGVEQLAVSWTAPAAAPAPENYRVEWKSGTQGYAQQRQAIVAATETSHTIQGLVGGTEHTVRVTATILYADYSAPRETTGTPIAPPPPLATQPLQQDGSDGGGDETPGGGGDETPGGGGDEVICPSYPTSETAADVERERDPDTLREFVQDARFGVESILREETEESEAIRRLVECFGVAGDWMSGSVYLFAITDGRKYFLAPEDSGLAGTQLNLEDENGCDVAGELIRAASEEQLQCEDLDLLPEGDADGFVQYLWDNPADTNDDSEPGYEDRGEAPGNSPKLSYVERITDEDILPGRFIILGSGYYPDWEPPTSGGGGGGGGCAVAGTGSTSGGALLNLVLAAGFLAVFAASRKKFRRTGP